jgi:L-seryl-tRNA(Ser) seleniumtransferase
MLAASKAALRERAEALRGRLDGLDVAIVETEGYVGAGSVPLVPLPSIAVAWRPRVGANAAVARLRGGTLPVIARAEGDRVVIDLRTIAPERDADVAAALQAAW